MLNTLESYIGPIPDNQEGVCAKFAIDDVDSPFVLSSIIEPGNQYTFNFWVRSEVSGSITACGATFEARTEWANYKITFTAASNDLLIAFGAVGTYYIYNPKLEVGNMATDWTPAPEDMATADQLNETSNSVSILYESVAQLSIESDTIKASVSKTEETVDSITGELELAKSEIASMKLESDELKIGFQEIAGNGVSKVVTETGFTFDSDGMTVDKTDSPTKTQVTPDGMTVYKKDAAGGQSEVLEATSEGVDATNLHAKTYLIIGGRSRFENYGADRTGCFWIGG